MKQISSERELQTFSSVERAKNYDERFLSILYTENWSQSLYNSEGRPGVHINQGESFACYT